MARWCPKNDNSHFHCRCHRSNAHTHTHTTIHTHTHTHVCRYEHTRAYTHTHAHTRRRMCHLYRARVTLAAHAGRYYDQPRGPLTHLRANLPLPGFVVFFPIAVVRLPRWNNNHASALAGPRGRNRFGFSLFYFFFFCSLSFSFYHARAQNCDTVPACTYMCVLHDLKI